MSTQTHREKSGGLCCLLWFQSASTTRPSKYSESFYSLTVLPPGSTRHPPPPHPPRLLFSVLALGVVVRVNEEARLRLSSTEEGSLLHGSLTLFSLANFSFRLASPPQKHSARIFLSPAQPPSSAPRCFWWWLWHACCHASVLQEVEINRAAAIWGEISRQTLHN